MKKITKKSLTEQMIKTMPDGTSHGIARLLFETYPNVFPSILSALGSVRYVRGATGNAVRKYATAPREPINSADCGKPMPKSIAKERLHFIVPERRVLLLPDGHVPYHSPEAFELALGYREFDAILITGDMLDFHRLSRFIPDEDSVSFAVEIGMGKDMLAFLSQYDVPIYYKVGNHEERLEHYFYQKAPEVSDLDLWRLPRLLDFDKYNVTEITDKRIVKLGGLSVLHGHELTKGLAAPVNPARGAYMKSKCSTLIGHHHKTSEHTETKLDGSIVTCWSTGCLSTLSPNYNPFGGYNHGFAFVEVDSDGVNYQVQNKRIHNGAIL
jgi:predicted phosphodiesterase